MQSLVAAPQREQARGSAAAGRSQVNEAAARCGWQRVGQKPSEVLGLITFRFELSGAVTEQLFIRLSDSIKQHLLTREFLAVVCSPSPHTQG